ncbi:MAG: hypothetical protein RLZZ361_1074 [Cyanobacteriota bacterium]|jgi:hypothetical protein
MKLKKHGKSTSKTEVVGVTQHGLWIHVNSQEFFLPFTEYPWFKKASLSDLLDLKLIHNHHLRWENLDIDLELESLNNLEKYKLKYL